MAIYYDHTTSEQDFIEQVANAEDASDTPAETTQTIGDLIQGSTQKATIVDNDRIGYWDSVADILKYMLFSDLKVVLKAWLDPLTTTFTNKRITRRAPTITQSETPAINTDVTDYVEIVGLAQAITSMTSGLTGTPVKGDKLHISFTDDGSDRAITFGEKFEASGTKALPTTTTAGVKLDTFWVWNTVTSKWRLADVS